MPAKSCTTKRGPCQRSNACAVNVAGQRSAGSAICSTVRPEGRSSEDWVDFDFHGHQIVAHLAPAETGDGAAHDVDGDNVPVRHFGLVLSMQEWHALADRLRAAGTRFVIEPHVRFQGKAGEQATMFLRDSCGNALEFKAFADRSQLFAR
ncbi:MAG: hypothetical protein WDW38_010582 [Sanguina aurantia]